jgi:hypothetical protein
VRWSGLLAAILACACAAVPPETTAEPAVEAERLVMPPALPGRAMSTPVIPVPEAAARAAPAEPPPVVALAGPVIAPEPPAVQSRPAVAAAPPAVQAAAEPHPVAMPRAAPGSFRGGPHVQLVAAGSAAEARAHWSGLVQRLPDLAEGRTPHILAFERAGQATIWRLRIGGFGDAGEARAWCERLRARGGNCWVAG